MRLLLLCLLMTISSFIVGQDSRLAQQYFADGEYEKASVLYEKLYQEYNQQAYYFDRYMECLIYLEQYEAAEKVVKKEIKKNPKNSSLYVSYGNLYERQFMDEKAEKKYREAINNLPADRFEVIKLANSFTTLTKYELAIEAFEKGIELLKDAQIFAYNLGDLYRRKGEMPKMIEHYLNSLADNPERMTSIKSMFQRYLGKDDYKELQIQLYDRLQQDEEGTYYNEMLTWVFIQDKDYKNALRQVKSLDKRLNENGGRVFNLANIAMNDNDYEAAIKAFDYIVDEKGPSSSYYIDAKRESLRCQRILLVDGYRYAPEDLLVLEQKYESFLNEFGRQKLTASIVLEFAELEAMYLGNLDKAIELLNEMIAYPGIDYRIQALGKLDLADYYLMKGEIWEATLLYSQVDKAFKDDILGHEARYRNAKLSYFAGDFRWAQAQFDVLKASTSKLIANDALDMAVFIMDNMGLDTTTTPLQLYAEAELMMFQNKFDKAFDKLDSISQVYPEHDLEDDLMYMKAQVYIKQRDYMNAVSMYEKIIANHSEEIRADNALMELAELYEGQLNDKEKAKELYEKLFLEYSSSTFAVEARKKFRQLRGDDI